MLIYPVTDQRCTAPSHAQNDQGYLLTREWMEYFGSHYIADRAQHEDWRASPLLHPDLANLPSALVLTAGFDRRATRAPFITMGKIIDEANAAVAPCAAELKRALRAGD